MVFEKIVELSYDIPGATLENNYSEEGTMSEDARKKMLRQPISKAELERRWKAVRTEMAKQKIDCLVTHSARAFPGWYGCAILPICKCLPMVVSWSSRWKGR